MRWFQEGLYEHHAQVLSVDRVLHQGRTKFQEVMIFENAIFGTVMVLDGVVQLTDLDNHIYHEMIAHVPLLAHGSANRVLIIGGGDGGTLKEVLKHPVSQVFLVELDGEVIDLAREYLPDVSAGAFEDTRATTIVGDGARFLNETRLSFDVIIVDSTDPIGPGASLFSRSFYQLCRLRLRSGGIMAAQSGAPFFQQEELDQVCRLLSQAFGSARPFLAPVPTYAGGMLALVAAGPSRDALRPPCKILRERMRSLRGGTRYYTPEVHRAAFALAPSFAPRSCGELIPSEVFKTGS